MERVKRIAAATAACACAFIGNAQLVVNNTITVADLVQNVLLGGGVTVSNLTFNGQSASQAYVQIGSFDGTNCNVGMNTGIMLSSGDINVALGPNDNSGDTEPLGGLGTPGDVDLDQASNSNTFDAAVLEFDFIPAGDSLSFNYVFASEEYLEFVNAGFNDVFGFFLSGPGISGPYQNNAANIALVPNTTIPVSIDNVNDVTNPGYYVDNGDGFTPPNSTDPQYIQFDGLTTVLTASALVECGQTYHIKIAIADAGDPILDSGVFIEGGSFTSPNAISIDITTESSDGVMTEGCTDALFTISRPGSADDIDITIQVSGSATNGVDYVPALPATITLPSGQSSVSFPVSPVEDGLSEGPESIILSATFVNACGDTSISVDSVQIIDYVPILLQTEDLSLDCSDDSVLIAAIASGGFGGLGYLWGTGAQQPAIWVPGLLNGVYPVTVTDECNKSVSQEVTVNAGCDIIIPNVFSPNGDGLNDVFYVEGITGTNNTVKIFNRWGRLVYEAKNYRNNWNGGSVSDGTYYYEIIVEGAPKPYTGHLTILSNRR
jgi:gliding motility-associated-like protein